MTDCGVPLDVCAFRGISQSSSILKGKTLIMSPNRNETGTKVEQLFKYVTGSPDALEKYFKRNSHVTPVYANAWRIIRSNPAPVVLFPGKIKQVQRGYGSASKAIVAPSKASLEAYEFTYAGTHKGVEFGTCTIPAAELPDFKVTHMESIDRAYQAECVIQEGATVRSGFSFSRSVLLETGATVENVYLDDSHVASGTSLTNTAFRRSDSVGNVTLENVSEAINVNLEAVNHSDGIVIKNLDYLNNLEIIGSANITGVDNAWLPLLAEDFSDFGEEDTAEYYSARLTHPAPPEKEIKDYNTAEFNLTCNVLERSKPADIWVDSTLCLVPEEHSKHLGKCHCLLWYPLYLQGEPLAVAYVNRVRGIKTLDILADVPVGYLEEALVKHALEHGKRRISEVF